ncbi:uncharacterized protein LOC132559419 [Ylistrum balloti]|uniref:uncharacterized protein LOC132559419 n=1 Tax=Ylistrum balloti TaxID=509963 RepID=UPI002905C7DA|nr:uncharacterized protein LOC132559419 [Ylistrum balloti]
MATDRTDHDIDDDIVCRVNDLLDLMGPRSTSIQDVDDISVKHFALLYHHVTGQVVPGSNNILSKRDGAKIGQFIVDSLADDIFGIPMDHVTGVGIVNRNRRMLADLLEIFGSIIQTKDDEIEIPDDETNSLDKLSTPIREVLLSLQDEVESLARSSMQNTKRATVQKVKDVYTQTTPISRTTAITSPVLWKHVLQRTVQGSSAKPPKQIKQLSRSTSNYMSQSYRPVKKTLTSKLGNPLSRSTSCLSRRTLQENTRPGTRQSGVSRTTSTTSPEVQNKLRRQPEQMKGSITLTKEINTEGGTRPPFLTQGLGQQQRKIFSTDDNNNLQLIDLCPSRRTRTSVSESRDLKPQNQRPMKKMIKPKPVISTKLRRKKSTGSVSSFPPNDMFMPFKANMCYNEKMAKLTDQVKSIRERRQETARQITQLQEESKSLQLLESLIIKEIKLTKVIEDRRSRPRDVYVM